ncbi:hypothetical protein NY78_1857 [Desulfovibrio sp. TomC]|nr:hypothetical protein NY78_1857 [Desulfovibrio sp. TomC]
MKVFIEVENKIEPLLECFAICNESIDADGLAVASFDVV